jgi:pyridoxine kinase
LSIQSHIAHGFVGNKAAAFPLQTMGFDIDCINTVTLSNHPAYANRCRGAGLESAVLRELLQGLEENGLMKYDALISGYTRQKEHLQEIVNTVMHIRDTHNPNLIYICDPVLGDNGSYYVPEELRDLYIEQVLPQATVITPNVFETQVLCREEQPVVTVAQAMSACSQLHANGPPLIILTGLSLSDWVNGSPSQDQTSTMMTSILSYRPKHAPHQEEIYRIDFPKQSGALSGCGDLFASLLTPAIYHVLHQPVSAQHSLWIGACIARCVAQAAETMSYIIRDTLQHQEVELRILAARDRLIAHSHNIREIVESYIQQSPHLWRDEHYRLSKSQSFPPKIDPVEDIAVYVRLLRHTGTSMDVPTSLTSPPSIPLRPIGVIFDMDGTLTLPGAIDFAGMRQALYDTHPPLREGVRDIVTSLNNLLPPTLLQTPEEQEIRALQDQLYAIVEEFEVAATIKQKLRPSLHALLLLLRKHCHIPLALCTRNGTTATQVFLETYDLPADVFDIVSVRNSVTHPSRDMSSMPIQVTAPSEWINKPHPAVAESILRQWQILVQEEIASNKELRRRVVFVGDSIDDMSCGRGAGCTTVLMLTDDNRSLLENEDTRGQIDFAVSSLEELAVLLVGRDIAANVEEASRTNI